MRYVLMFSLVCFLAAVAAAPATAQIKSTATPRAIPLGPEIAIEGEIQKPRFQQAPRKIKRKPMSFISPRRDFRQAVLSSVANL